MNSNRHMSQPDAGRDRDRFYDIVRALSERLPSQALSECHGRMSWPTRGIYLFMEQGERRPDGTTPRIVRIGTHALKTGASTKLWTRLSQHQGVQKSGGGNHRGSVFRRHVGAALLAKEPELSCSTWSIGSNAPRNVRDAEMPMETLVSQHVRGMPFIWVDADDEPGPSSIRAYLESNLIALLSCAAPTGGSADPPSTNWLGRHSPNKSIRASGMWNVRDTEGSYDPDVLQAFEECARRTPSI